MGKVLATRSYPLATGTRSRKASTSSQGPFPVKLACSHCAKAFVRRGDLKRHEQLHTGVKNHECPECHKRFSQNSGLKTHMNVHTGHKPYRCTYDGCGAEFGDPSSHARHKKETHLVDYRYECPYENCGSAIKRRSAFAQHLIKKHDDMATSDQLDDYKKLYRQPTHRRKSGHSNLDAPASATAQFYYADNTLHNATVQYSKPSVIAHQPSHQHQELYHRKAEAPYFYNDHGVPQHEEPFFTPPISSSSTETLLDEFTNSKLFFGDSHVVDPMVHLATSLTPPPTSSPFAKDSEYHSSPIPLPISELHRSNSQHSYDHSTRYIDIASAHHAPYHFDQKTYGTVQEIPKDIDYSHSHFNVAAPQNPNQHWGQWEFT